MSFHHLQNVSSTAAASYIGRKYTLQNRNTQMSNLSISKSVSSAQLQIHRQSSCHHPYGQQCITSPTADTAALGAGSKGKKKKKRIEKGTRSTYVFKLAYEVRSLEATASIKTEANVQT